MYEENRTGYVLKDILLQIILVVIFVFLLLWLFPTKGYVDNKIDESLDPIYQDLFNDHLQSMTDAAQSYYTTSRLPKKVGDKVSITLGEMLDKKLVSPFVDSNNKQCSLTASYVEVTKMDSEYMMKVSLNCSDKSDYIIVYMGCYDYCDDGLCQKEQTTTKPTVNNSSNNNNNQNNNNNNNNTIQTDNKVYQYEYKLTTDGKYGDWSSWSNWSTSKVTETNYRDVDTKEVKKVVDTKKVKVDTQTTYEKAEKDVTTKNYSVKSTLQCPTGYKQYDPNNSNSKLCVAMANTTTSSVTNTVTDYVDAVATTVKICPDGSTPINDYCPSVTTNQETIAATASTVYGEWVYSGRKTYTGTKVTTATTKYVYVSSKDDFDCENACKVVTKNTYDVYTRSNSTKYSCPTGYTLSGTNCVKNVSNMVHVYGIWTVQTTYSCANGATMVNGKCPVTTTTSTPVSSTSCPNGGTYDSSMGVCYVRGTMVSQCPSGVDGEIVNGKCVVETVKYTCDEGTLVEGTNKCKITKNVYETQNVYDYVTYYRYRTREYVSGNTKTIWSYSKNDRNLLDEGYVLTGKKKEVTKA